MYASETFPKAPYISRITTTPTDPVDPTRSTAAILVGGFGWLGVHTTLAAMAKFPGQFKNILFLSVGVIDSGSFKGEEALDRLREQTEKGLRQYVELAAGQGMPADYRLAIGTDVVQQLDQLCLKTASEFRDVMFFAGQLVFQQERWYQRLLHNETAFALQKRLQLADLTMIILPTRVK